MTTNLDTILDHLSREPTACYDVAEIALLLARDEYTDLDVEGYLSELDGMAHDLRDYLRGNLAVQLHGLCRYLFHELGFHGNINDYYDPLNSYLNVVLERRTGIPISLSALVMAVGTRASMRIQGVGLPGHFIVKASTDTEEILFDPFHGGRRLEREDCECLVQQVTGMPLEITPANLQGLPLGLMVQRMLNNLKAIYLGKGDFRRGVRIIRRLHQLEPDNPLHHRDLGACMVHLRQPGKALDQLETYLGAVPDADDADQVEKLILQAQRELARWN